MRRVLSWLLVALLAPLLPSGCLTGALFDAASEACRTDELRERVSTPTQLVRAGRTADGALHVEVSYVDADGEPELCHYVLAAAAPPRRDLPLEVAWPAALPRVGPRAPLPELQRAERFWPGAAIPVALDRPGADGLAVRLAGSELQLCLGEGDPRPVGRLPIARTQEPVLSYWPMIGAVLLAPFTLTIDIALIGLYALAHAPS